MTFDLTGTAYVKYMLVVGNANAVENLSNFRTYVGNSADYTRNAECEGGPYLETSSDDYMDNKMGVEVSCGITGRYVTLVKEYADPGMSQLDICTFGVLATCDCSALELTWENTEEYFDSVQVRRGERNVFDLHAPEYKTTDTNLEGACTDMAWDCEFWYGIRQPADRSK